MKKSLISAGIASIILSGSALASSAPQTAPVNPWYVQLNAGPNWLNEIKATVENTSPPIRVNAKFDTGYGVAGSIGYTFPINLSLEAELGFFHNRLNRLIIPNVLSFKESGKTDVTYGMLNALYRIQTNSPLTPYFGAGLGVAHTVHDYNRNANGFTGGHGSDNVFAYQGILGLSYGFNSHWSASLDYRYLRTNPATLTVHLGSGAGAQIAKFREHLSTNMLMAGVAYHFS